MTNGYQLCSVERRASAADYDLSRLVMPGHTPKALHQSADRTDITRCRTKTDSGHTACVAILGCSDATLQVSIYFVLLLSFLLYIREILEHCTCVCAYTDIHIVYIHEYACNILLVNFFFLNHMTE